MYNNTMYTKSMFSSNMSYMRLTPPKYAHLYRISPQAFNVCLIKYLNQCLNRVILSWKVYHTNFYNKSMILARCSGGVMWWFHCLTCACWRCLSGTVVVTSSHCQGLCIRCGVCFLALWLPTCQPGVNLKPLFTGMRAGKKTNLFPFTNVQFHPKKIPKTSKKILQKTSQKIFQKK